MAVIEISDELAVSLKARAEAEGLALDAWLERLVFEEGEAETEEEEAAKLAWLRAAAKEGFDAIDRGEYTVLNSDEELAAFLDQILDEVNADSRLSAALPDQNLERLLSGPARGDIAAILRRSSREFGKEAALRYRTLIFQAIRDIAADRKRPGSFSHPQIIEGPRTYHLQFSRDSVVGDRVKAHRHVLLYRMRGDVLEVVRVLHDAQDLKHQLRVVFGS